MSLRKKVVYGLLERVTKTNKCAIDECGSKDDVQTVKLLPLDPVDHMGRVVPLCKEHREWAKERNELAEDMIALLREERKAIGQAHISEIQELAEPEEGELSEEQLMGNATNTMEQISTPGETVDALPSDLE